MQSAAYENYGVRDPLTRKWREDGGRWSASRSAAIWLSNKWLRLSQNGQHRIAKRSLPADPQECFSAPRACPELVVGLAPKTARSWGAGLKRGNALLINRDCNNLHGAVPAISRHDFGQLARRVDPADDAVLGSHLCAIRRVFQDFYTFISRYLANNDSLVHGLRCER